MRDSRFFDGASARDFARDRRASKSLVFSDISSLHRLRSSADDRGCPGPAPTPSPQGGADRGNIFQRLEHSLIGDLIGAVALFARLAGGLWFGAVLS